MSNISTFSKLLSESLLKNTASNSMLLKPLVESLPENVMPILPQNYNYIVSKFYQFSNYITPKEFLIDQFKIDFFVNINDIEDTQQ
ncbi:2423_t:CDS:2 [Dentiscutata erythropus]|uniref:2423_t:CDS:1 n=1 Tax=Dentiscutata erythropus TaxID=1348616 RepID=A0A9N9IDY2_9GLOM|nr:2423_t:CDS:2 [Dentiscutata erythropus]